MLRKWCESGGGLGRSPSRGAGRSPAKKIWEYNLLDFPIFNIYPESRMLNTGMREEGSRAGGQGNLGEGAGEGEAGGGL